MANNCPVLQIRVGDAESSQLNSITAHPPGEEMSHHEAQPSAMSVQRLSPDNRNYLLNVRVQVALSQHVECFL